MWEPSRAALKVGDAAHAEAGSLGEYLLRQAGHAPVPPQQLSEACSFASHEAVSPTWPCPRCTRPPAPAEYTTLGTEICVGIAWVEWPVPRLGRPTPGWDTGRSPERGGRAFSEGGASDVSV